MLLFLIQKLLYPKKRDLVELPLVNYAERKMHKLYF
jgi:hypothetical protein